ncbi:MAG: hypothetical protein JWP74_3243 [Marmoricola sp.]|nr:hypothetical protein [Marmoricola sp.]
MSDKQPPGRIKDISVYRDSFIGMAVLACTPFLIFGAISVYGWLAAVGLLLVWLVLLLLGTRWFMPHPRWVVGVGVVSMLCWLAVVLIAQ